MKIYLDDERQAPEGWLQARWPEEVVELLKTGKVEAISLDHDLGECSTQYENPRTGYDVLIWLERQVALHSFKPPEIFIHTMNVPARKRMVAAVRNIKRFPRGKL